MSNRKTRTVKTTLLYKGQKVEYQVLLEDTMGMMLASLSIYNENEGIATLEADCDYEVIIRPKK